MVHLSTIEDRAQYSNKMSSKDVQTRADIEQIVRDFYDVMLKDPIIGYIFTDVARIHLESHLPTIIDFWCDIVFQEKQYRGNALQKHLELNDKIPLTPGHFTRWLYLFNRAVDGNFAGDNAELMKHRAELVAKSISAAITDQKKGDMQLVLPRD